MSTSGPYDAYANNPLIHRDRRLDMESSVWVRGFSCADMSPLIVCRGPIRKEAIDVFREMGMEKIGILLSERDSIVYPRALAPELRILDPDHVHRVPDYTGATREERLLRVEQMIEICREYGYDSIFAGYGFMAEDAEFVRAIERAGLTFIGPCSGTQDAAGKKDEAKRTALANDVSVTPGVSDATAKTLLAKHPDRAALEALATSEGLDVPALATGSGASLDALAEAVLDASYAKGIDLFTIDELGATLEREAVKMLAEYPGSRVRLKAIGGGGGKGQRIISSASEVPGRVLEILQEVKATGPGDDKNLLLELNIEQTRHNEIQMLGNGVWCVTLGGRDCSLQMHEQKLLEVSVTREGLAKAIAEAHTAGRTAEAEALEMDLTTLERMEAEAERFGRAVRLDSASTFECIVEGSRHFFMEVNTRIQVEHRVSELCYALRFTNPKAADDAFEVHSLVEAMALVARHKTRLPKPTRVPREGAAVEARLNATDRSLSPHAGGVIVSWSEAIPGEIRDDQGISIRNPDTGLFMRYRLAGAYDSNVALLLATGDDRRESYEMCAEILRAATIRGEDLATNLEFHHGLVTWFLAHGVWSKPTTKFVVPYLTLVGLLKQEADTIDLDTAFQQLARRTIAAAESAGPEVSEGVRKVLALKETLVERPLEVLMDEPHELSAWLSEHRNDFSFEGETVTWKTNPVEVLESTYRLLEMLDQPEATPAHVIWEHDKELLDQALGFYAKIAERAPDGIDFPTLDAALRSPEPAFGFDAELWEKVRAAHAGHQLGLEMLSILPLVVRKVGFYDLRVLDDMTIEIPERLHDPELQAAMRKVLVPPPVMKSDEIVAASGGMLYLQEAPNLPPFVSKGSHFDKGDPLYIIEVMKMFNKVTAPFAGTVDDVLVEGDGTIVHKGQSLFKVTPDETIVVEDPTVRAKRIRTSTTSYLERIVS